MKLRDGVHIAETDYGAALLDEDSGQYFNLNPTGALVLDQLLGGNTFAQAAKELTAHYDVDMENATQDVQDLVRELQLAGLVEHQEARTGGTR